MMGTFGQPELPRGIMRGMVELRAPAQVYDPNNGGQFASQEPERIPFEGSVLPLSGRDLREAPAGTYTKDSMKLYTNEHDLTPGQEVYDPYTSGTYLVTGKMAYGPIGRLRRYVVELKGKAAPK